MRTIPILITLVVIATGGYFYLSSGEKETAQENVVLSNAVVLEAFEQLTHAYEEADPALLTNIVHDSIPVSVAIEHGADWETLLFTTAEDFKKWISQINPSTALRKNGTPICIQNVCSYADDRPLLDAPLQYLSGAEFDLSLDTPVVSKIHLIDNN